MDAQTMEITDAQGRTVALALLTNEGNTTAAGRPGLQVTRVNPAAGWCDVGRIDAVGMWPEPRYGLTSDVLERLMDERLGGAIVWTYEYDVLDTIVILLPAAAVALGFVRGLNGEVINLTETPYACC